MRSDILCSLFFLSIRNSLVDPAMSHTCPSTTDRQDSWSGVMDQNTIGPAGDTNIEGIVSDIISSNFPQVTY